MTFVKILDPCVVDDICQNSNTFYFSNTTGGGSQRTFLQTLVGCMQRVCFIDIYKN